jgi:ABC-type branched-subunit amino acid transport system substrate-binding protein
VQAPLAGLIALLAVGPSCGGGAQESAPPVRIGLLLSYTGELSANSINSERGLLMAIEAANQAGGIGGRPVAVVARDTGGDPTRASAPAQQLVDTGVSLIIGPDTPSLGVQLKPVLSGQTMILPSYATASNFAKPPSWFVMGPSPKRMACELFAQMHADGRRVPLVVADAAGYDGALTIELTEGGLSAIRLPPKVNESTLLSLAAMSPDAWVLAASPPSAAAVLNTLAALGALNDPTRWYLSPTLHTPALLDAVPGPTLRGVRGVAPGTGAGAIDFRTSFSARWQDIPFDDAYAFYDAGAVAVLALQRALVHGGNVAPGLALIPDVVAVTHALGTPVSWNELGRGLELLRQGQEVSYVGLSGVLEFDANGTSLEASTKWWTIVDGAFVDIPSQSGCRAEEHPTF